MPALEDIVRSLTSASRETPARRCVAANFEGQRAAEAMASGSMRASRRELRFSMVRPPRAVMVQESNEANFELEFSLSRQIEMLAPHS